MEKTREKETRPSNIFVIDNPSIDRADWSRIHFFARRINYVAIIDQDRDT